MPCLTIIDVTGIQNYIFGSNRLKEIVGASEIVAQATSWWIFDVLRDELNWETNLNTKSENHKSPFDVIDKNKVIETDKLNAEVIYAGGGNTLILFNNREKAVEFAKKYTLKLLKDARGLETVIAHSDEFEMSNGKIITETADKTFVDLGIKKANLQSSTPMLGLAVTAQCVSTGGVANEIDKERKKYISKESFQKQEFNKKAKERLIREVLEQAEWKGLDVPSDFDDLGRTKGEASFIAVVHTDGNGMGKRVENVGEKAKDNREWINKMREFSESIYNANINAMEKTVEQILWKINADEKELKDDRKETFALSQNEHKTETYFPFRPLIFGGDDLTFVCDGRIALSLTAFYVKELVKKDADGDFIYKLSDGKPIYARAGVSIIKSHYPFSRAYKLAEKLAKSAKDRIKKIDEENQSLDEEKNKIIAIDWHVAMSGLLGNLEEIRDREYTVRDGKLNMRPLVLHSEKSSKDWRTWQIFSEIISEFQGDKWKDRRNKLKTLREYLRQGKNESRSFLHLAKLELPVMETDSGWTIDTCVHFDAIEMLDLYYPIEKAEEKNDE